jgi:ComF family protein
LARGGLRCGQLKEAVFSSSEDRIRASQASVAVARPPIALEKSSSPFSRTWLGRTAASVFSVLFPSNCSICVEPLLNISRLPVCPACLDAIYPEARKVCDVCGERVLSSFAFSDDDGVLRCPVCRRIERPFERAVAYGSYDGGLRELIHLLKFNGVRPAAGVLGRMLAEAMVSLESVFGQSGPAQSASAQSAPEKVLVIPVPLFKGKRRGRGFNQAELIASAALKVYGSERLQLATDILHRVRETRSQIGLTSHQRRENMRGAFAVLRASEVAGRAVLLVDDVYTTGTTVTECARILRRAGAAKVSVATVARTQKHASKYLGKPQGIETDVMERVIAS